MSDPCHTAPSCAHLLLPWPAGKGSGLHYSVHPAQEEVGERAREGAPPRRRVGLRLLLDSLFIARGAAGPRGSVPGVTSDRPGTDRGDSSAAQPSPLHAPGSASRPQIRLPAGRLTDAGTHQAHAPTRRLWAFEGPPLCTRTRVFGGQDCPQLLGLPSPPSAAPPAMARLLAVTVALGCISLLYLQLPSALSGGLGVGSRPSGPR